MIAHGAGVAPEKESDPPSSELLAADGTALRLALGQWNQAAGTVTLRCSAGEETVESNLRGFIAGGLTAFSTFT